jgi:hypothetical protein
MQLDLFRDSRDVMLRNELIAALRARDLPTILIARAALAEEHPHDTLLDPTDILVNALEAQPARIPNHDQAQRAAREVDRELTAAATATLGTTHATDWLESVWHTLAKAVQHLPYQSHAPKAHAAHMHIRARRWSDAALAVQGIDAWRRQPAPLAWMTEATFHQHGLDAAWPLLAELAWRDPTRFAPLTHRLAPAAPATMLERFERDFLSTHADYPWFPAWALINEPSLQTVLRTAETPELTPPEQAARTILQLLTLERQGRHREIIERRKTLRALHPGLFAHYMHTRA